MGRLFGGIHGSSFLGDVLKKGAEVENNEFYCFYLYAPKKDRLTFRLEWRREFWGM
jgi:hypothetical protein